MLKPAIVLSGGLKVDLKNRFWIFAKYCFLWIGDHCLSVFKLIASAKAAISQAMTTKGHFCAKTLP